MGVARVRVELVTQHGRLPEAPRLVASSSLRPGVVEAERLVRLLLAARRPLPLLVLVAQDVGGWPWRDAVQGPRWTRVARQLLQRQWLSGLWM